MKCRGYHGDCPNQAKRGPYCWGHLKMLKRTGRTDAPLREPKGAARDRAGIPRRSRAQQLEDAAIDLAEANAEGDHSEYRRAKKRLMIAASRTPRWYDQQAPSPRPRGRPPTGTSRVALWRRRRKQQ